METIRAFAETFFRQAGAHGPDHILRVTRLCKEIGRAGCAVGIAWTFMQAGEHGDDIGNAVSHLHEKLLNLRRLMYTAAAADIAERRHALLQRFVDSLEDETGTSLTSPADRRTPFICLR
ncbi:HD domain-containing protein [Methanogenium organophilum]|uniref:Uncharacterized protein n=1 Tax=Methanogenium organophilum TaxID=2199 RepID=A0A9X9T873_METOG|nr:hypothetical protein [Methanogenium organophilum]WAI01420.1 hypothetical protein OU421_00670 [Methanogenium organophilum]